MTAERRVENPEPGPVPNNTHSSIQLSVARTFILFSRNPWVTVLT